MANLRHLPYGALAVLAWAAGCTAPGAPPPTSPDSPPRSPASAGHAAPARGTDTGAAPSGAERDWSEHPDYPFDAVAQIYDMAVEHLIPHVYDGEPELAAAHTERLRAFVLETLPREAFVARMVEHDRATFERGRRERAFRETRQFQDAVHVLLRVSASMALIDVAQRVDVYDARFARPRPELAELLALARTPEQEVTVSWIQRELDAREVEELGEHIRKRIEPGDRIFHFFSPSWYWEQMAGREGYLIVRGDAIVDRVVTSLN